MFLGSSLCRRCRYGRGSTRIVRFHSLDALQVVRCSCGLKEQVGENRRRQTFPFRLVLALGCKTARTRAALEQEPIDLRIRWHPSEAFSEVYGRWAPFGRDQIVIQVVQGYVAQPLAFKTVSQGIQTDETLMQATAVDGTTVVQVEIAPSGQSSVLECSMVSADKALATA